VVALAILAGMIVAPITTLVVFMAVATLAYCATLGYRLLLLRSSLRGEHAVVVSDEDARAIPEGSLPVYTVLVPAYREPEVIADALAAIDALEYPHSKLDVKVILEADDAETRAAVRAANPPSYVDVVLVPPADPRTKPKACNYGLCGAAGEFVTVFDAEDRPEPLQLRRAVLALRRLPPDVACLQAQLTFHNTDQNVITRWFGIEYLMWFRFFLPGLIRLGAPLPLGGTSNHFRRDTLHEVGAWDPHNVTEDADLGIRLHRAGYRVGVLQSVTEEEANSDFINWAKQRSRWYKGYLQTWLVHMRAPRRLWREVGPAGFVGFNLFVGGTPLLALINPIFWTLTVAWFIGRPAFVAALFPAWVYYPSVACWLFGNAAVAYANVLVVRAARRPALTMAALLSPLYWIMMSVAAVKAFWQLVSSPFLWEKTTHGLDRPLTVVQVPRASR